jgi:hypothetical protein
VVEARPSGTTAKPRPRPATSAAPVTEPPTTVPPPPIPLGHKIKARDEKEGGDAKHNRPIFPLFLFFLGSFVRNVPVLVVVVADVVHVVALLVIPCFRHEPEPVLPLTGNGWCPMPSA